MRTVSLLCIATACMFVVCFSGCGKKEEEKRTGPAETAGGDLNAQIESSMNKGAEYLISKMNEQGVITITYKGKQIPDAGITALGIAAMTHIHDKSDKVKKAVEKGGAYLASLKKEDGGIYLDPKAAPPTYVTAVAILALSRIDSERYKDIIKGGTGLSGREAGKE